MVAASREILPKRKWLPLGTQAGREYLKKIRSQYRKAFRKEKKQIPDEFCAACNTNLQSKSLRWSEDPKQSPIRVSLAIEGFISYRDCFIAMPSQWRYQEYFLPEISRWGKIKYNNKPSRWLFQLESKRKVIFPRNEYCPGYFPAAWACTVMPGQGSFCWSIPGNIPGGPVSVQREPGFEHRNCHMLHHISGVGHRNCPGLFSGSRGIRYSG